MRKKVEDDELSSGVRRKWWEGAEEYCAVAFYCGVVAGIRGRSLRIVHSYLRSPQNGNVMEGVLWKWTNYWNGWQMRWFVLDNGVLAYYKSQEEVSQGCKGSVIVSACEISVHPSDNTRLDVIVPGEQHIYLKAASSQERQEWLIALGSSKACVSSRKRKESADFSPDSLRSKRSELRLYCDLLMQQVHQIKLCATEGTEFDLKKFNDASSLLSVTCDTFIKTLDDCIQLSNGLNNQIVHHQHVDSAHIQRNSHSVKVVVPTAKLSISDGK